MRMLHTSDWHLGRRLHGADLAAAHEAWVDHVVEVVREEGVEVLLVAGDVFDRAIAPVEAIAAWDRALAQVTEAGAQVVVSSGNHDSPARLGAHGSLLARAGVHVRCDPTRVGEPVVLHDAHGPVAFYPLPYLEPMTTAGPLGRLGAPGVDVDEHVARSQQGVVARAAALAAAEARAGSRPRTVALAHTWVSGVRPEDRSDSEREIGCCPPKPVGGTPEATGVVPLVGGLDRVATRAFEPFAYTALGHLHGPQVLGERLRYSGSPVAFSFSERHHRKGSWLVDLDETGAVTVERVEAPVHRRLTQLSGTLAELLSDAGYARATDDHVKAVLTDAARPADAMRRLQERFPHAVALEWVPVGATADRPCTLRLSSAATDTEVAAGFVAHVRGTEATPAEQTALDAAFLAVAAASGERLAVDDPAPQRVRDDLAGLDGSDEWSPDGVEQPDDAGLVELVDLVDTTSRPGREEAARGATGRATGAAAARRRDRRSGAA